MTGFPSQPACLRSKKGGPRKHADDFFLSSQPLCSTLLPDCQHPKSTTHSIFPHRPIRIWGTMFPLPHWFKGLLWLKILYIRYPRPGRTFFLRPGCRTIPKRGGMSAAQQHNSIFPKKVINYYCFAATSELFRMFHGSHNSCCANFAGLLTMIRQL